MTSILQSPALQSHPPTDQTAATGELIQWGIRALAWAVFALLVLVDGLRNPASLESRLLTIPYFIGGLAFCRSIGESLNGHHYLHTALFLAGLLTLGALA
ncbi:MAG: hypothetical protein KDI44_18025 [Thiothrix sp.]|nr:hypothetical protein [Thiothrix sp.]HPQ96947.1 hypothetical protein [Thiolinea sp.]